MGMQRECNGNAESWENVGGRPVFPRYSSWYSIGFGIYTVSTMYLHCIYAAGYPLAPERRRGLRVSRREDGGRMKVIHLSEISESVDWVWSYVDGCLGKWNTGSMLRSDNYP